MEIKPGQVYRHNKRRDKTIEISEKDDFFQTGWKVRFEDGKFGLSFSTSLLMEYSLDEQWVVGEILNKYGQIE